MSLRKEFISVNQRCEELSLSFDNIFQILVKLLVGINKKLKNTHYHSLQYFVGYNPSSEAEGKDKAKSDIQIEDFDSSVLPEDNVFNRHTQAFGQKKKNNRRAEDNTP